MRIRWCENQLCQNGIGLAVLGIWTGSGGIWRIILALVVKFMPLPPRVGNQGRPGTGSPGKNAATRPLAIRRIIGPACKDGEVGAGAQQIFRIRCGKADDTRKAIASKQRRSRPTQDFHRFHQAEIHIIAASSRLCTKIEAIRHANAVHLNEHAVAAKAANGKSGVAVPPGRA